MGKPALKRRAREEVFLLAGSFLGNIGKHKVPGGNSVPLRTMVSRSLHPKVVYELLSAWLVRMLNRLNGWLSLAFSMAPVFLGSQARAVRVCLTVTFNGIL